MQPKRRCPPDNAGTLSSDFQPAELWNLPKLWAKWEREELADEGQNIPFIMRKAEKYGSGFLSQKDFLICTPRIWHTYLPTHRQHRKVKPNLCKTCSSGEQNIHPCRQTAPKLKGRRGLAGTPSSSSPDIPWGIHPISIERNKEPGCFKKNPSLWKLEEPGRSVLIFPLALLEN